MAKVRSALDALYADIEALLDEVDELYLGPAEDTAALRRSFQDIQDAQESLLAFAALPSSDTDVIAAYEEEHLYPLYEAFEENAQQILTYVRSTQQRIFTGADHLGKSSLVWSLIIITAVTLGLFFFQYTIRNEPPAL